MTTLATREGQCRAWAWKFGNRINDWRQRNAPQIITEVIPSVEECYFVTPRHVPEVSPK
jgi:hypothetical protein